MVLNRQKVHGTADMMVVVECPIYMTDTGMDMIGVSLCS